MSLLEYRSPDPAPPREHDGGKVTPADPPKPGDPPLPDDPGRVPPDLFAILAAWMRQTPEQLDWAERIRQLEGWLEAHPDHELELSVVEHIYIMATTLHRKSHRAGDPEAAAKWRERRLELHGRLRTLAEAYAPIQDWRMDDPDLERFYATITWRLRAKATKDPKPPMYPYNRLGCMVERRALDGSYSYRPFAYQGMLGYGKRTIGDNLAQELRDRAIMCFFGSIEGEGSFAEGNDRDLTETGSRYADDAERVRYLERAIRDFADVPGLQPRAREMLLKYKRRLAAGEPQP